MNPFLKSLNDIACNIKELSPLINNGGCGFLANFFHDHLSNFSSISDVKIKSVMSYYDNEDFKEIPLEFIFKMFDKEQRIPSDIQEYYQLLERFQINHQEDFLYHLACSFKYNDEVYLIDADYGVCTEQEYIDLSESVISNHSWNITYLKSLLDEPSNWNETFTRSSVPHIESLLAFKFSKLRQLFGSRQSETKSCL